MSEPNQPECPPEAKREKFYLTTPIYYVNARPHIGHAYSTIVADVLARRHRLLGHDTFFLTGTDEHGQKIERSAAAAGIPPQEFADQVSKTFSDLWKRMGITNDDFIRTTEPRHKVGVQKLFRDLSDAGHIYLSTYTGQYSIGEEMFVDGPPGTIGPDGRPTETVTEENFFFRLSAFQRPLLDLIESGTLKVTPESSKNEVLSFLRGNVPNAVQLRLDKASLATGAQIELLQHAEHPGSSIGWSYEGEPYLRGALKDLSVSRSSFTWGIPVPEEVQLAAGATQKHVVYVWLDALVNYMTAVGYGDPAKADEFRKWWPADLHLVGKEITRFHCVYWPAFLLALNSAALESGQEQTQIPFGNDSQKSKGNNVGGLGGSKWLPKQVTANGWLLFDNAKMSKSKGNVVRTETILDGFGDHVYGKQFPESSKAERDLFASDVLRYFLLREIPFGQDGSFSFEAMVTRYNADLANGYGNLVSRTLTLIQKNFGSRIPEPRVGLTLRSVAEFIEVNVSEETTRFFSGLDPNPYTPLFLTTKIVDRFNLDIQNHDFSAALRNLWSAIAYVDRELSLYAPWKLVLDPARKQDAADILYMSSEFIRVFTLLLSPFMPNSALKVWLVLGLEPEGLLGLNSRPDFTSTWGGLQPGLKLGALAPIFPRADKSLAEIMMEMEVVTPPLAKGAKDGAPGVSGRGDNHVMPTEDTTQQPAAPATHPAEPLKEHGDPIPAVDPKDDPTHPAAPPRTASLDVENPGSQVGGSHAVTTERDGTPPHTEALASGIFAAQPVPDTPQIAIDDFTKIDLRVAKILVAERIPKADKLLRLEVDLGYEQRQILSGIAEHYAPEELIGRKIVIIANLAPRKMRGLESRGMLLAASEGENGKPVLATLGEEIAVGTRLR